jgi:hypothetical protein
VHTSTRFYDAPMSRAQDIFVAAGEDLAQQIEFPEIVMAFEELGFVRVGRLRRSDPGGLWREAAVYPRPVRTDYVSHRAVPSVVLAAPDRSAFVTVTWWWGMPDVRIRTALTDGAVVETVRAWDRSPVPPRGHRRIYRDGDLRQEQLLANAPAGGRRMALASGEAPDLWTAHRRSVSEASVDTGADAALHEDMAGALALSNRLARHHVACHRAQVRRGLRILATLMLFGLAVILASVVLPPAATLLLLVMILLAIVLVIGFRRRIRALGFGWRYDAGRRPALET